MSEFTEHNWRWLQNPLRIFSNRRICTRCKLVTGGFWLGFQFVNGVPVKRRMIDEHGRAIDPHCKGKDK